MSAVGYNRKNGSRRPRAYKELKLLIDTTDVLLMMVHVILIDTAVFDSMYIILWPEVASSKLMQCSNVHKKIT